jgi:hypothetical protein
VITAENVLGSVEQGLDPGAFNKLVQAMLDRATYANVHTEGTELVRSVAKSRLKLASRDESPRTNSFTWSPSFLRSASR